MFYVTRYKKNKSSGTVLAATNNTGTCVTRFFFYIMHARICDRQQRFMSRFSRPTVMNVGGTSLEGDAPPPPWRIYAVLNKLNKIPRLRQSKQPYWSRYAVEVCSGKWSMGNSLRYIQVVAHGVKSLGTSEIQNMFLKSHLGRSWSRCGPEKCFSGKTGCSSAPHFSKQ